MLRPNTDFFLVRIFPHSDWIRRDTEYLSIWTLFTQCVCWWFGEKTLLEQVTIWPRFIGSNKIISQQIETCTCLNKVKLCLSNGNLISPNLISNDLTGKKRDCSYRFWSFLKINICLITVDATLCKTNFI